MSRPPAAPQGGDPWHAFGYITSGVAFYGLLGWLADRWLGTSFLVAIGILIGAGLGIFLTLQRFRPFDAPPPTSTRRTTSTQPPASQPRPHEH